MLLRLLVAPAQLSQAPAQGVPTSARSPALLARGGGAGGAWSPYRQLPPLQKGGSVCFREYGAPVEQSQGVGRVSPGQKPGVSQGSAGFLPLQLQEGALGPWGFPAPFLFLDRILYQVGTVGCPAAGASAAVQRWGRGEEEASSPCPRERVAEQGRQTGGRTCSCVCGWRGGITHGASIVLNGRNGSWDQNPYKSLE